MTSAPAMYKSPFIKIQEKRLSDKGFIWVASIKKGKGKKTGSIFQKYNKNKEKLTAFFGVLLLCN